METCFIQELCRLVLIQLIYHDSHFKSNLNEATLLKPDEWLVNLFSLT
jgi:hypothetical protein